tara:strand:+ start:1608 stop:2099 length:492 start_codon:yes stop_codon:yes gene_type:complete
MFDATFWVAISFLLFVILILYKKVPRIVLSQIDSKILELKNKINEAENLKSSSEKLLSHAQGKLEKSENERSEILKKAQKISDDEISISSKKMEVSLHNKETAAYNKIKQAKNEAINFIKKEATKIAIETVQKVIQENLDSKKQEEINITKLKQSISKLENTN